MYPKKKRGDGVNKNLLHSYMAKVGDTQQRLADSMGISLSTLNAKINENKAEFKQGELAFIKRRYSLNSREMDAVFFRANVSEKDTA